jgi:hypothetical protein
MPPRGLDPVTAARAAQLRAAERGQDTLDADERADTAHRGADTARKMLADRDRPSAAAERAEPRELHGPALAAAQTARSRAERGAPVAVDEPDELRLPDADEPLDDDTGLEEDEPPF